ncbi:MAG: FAD-binding oxidoreductase [Rhodoglobus sp.]
MTEYTSLRSRVSGPVLEPSDPGYADEAAGFNLAVVHSPDAVVGATSASDVAETVKFARANGLRVHVQSTGHGAEAPIVGGVLVTTRRLDSVSVDGPLKIATVGGGAQWASVVDAAANVRLAPVTGSSTNVGVVGYLTGGGLGPLSRSHGFSSDYVRGFTVVIGTGEIVEASPLENSDLFWALRGGKFGLGIVTEVRIALVELDTLYAGSLLFAEEHIEAVARGWAEWTATAPDDVTTSIGIFRFPDLEFIPEPVRGRTLLNMHFAYPGGIEEGERLAAPLRALAPVYLDSLAELPARDVALIHNDPTNPGPGWATGALLGPIDQDFVTAWLGQLGSGAQTPLMIGEIRHLGGAVRTDVPEGSAAGGRTAAYTLSFIGAPNPALFAEVVPAAADRAYAAVAPWISPESNINFVGVNRPGQTGQPWLAEPHARLVAVRAAHDPDGVFAR